MRGKVKGIKVQVYLSVLAEVVRMINDIGQEKDIVGLTVAEPMPCMAIRIKNKLCKSQ